MIFGIFYWLFFWRFKDGIIVNQLIMDKLTVKLGKKIFKSINLWFYQSNVISTQIKKGETIY